MKHRVLEENKVLILNGLGKHLFSGYGRGTQTTFAEKHCLPTWAHELTENRRSLASLPPFCICLCSNHSLYSHFATTLDSNKDK
jgi:hypothetical protein